MRLNIPVNNVEYALNEHETIVSTTDLKGVITYANPYFIEASGYAAEELIGAPQNILRHPDMPPEAFGDLWATIEAGLSWTGMVKNRRKNGDYYWVLANVTPVIENGRPIGYMSVRTKPSREQVAAATDLYRSMQDGISHRIALQQGRVVKTGWLSKLAALRHIPLGRRIRLSLSFLLIATGVLDVLAWSSGATQHPGLVIGMNAVAASAIAVIAWLWHSLETGVVTPLQQALKAAQTMAGGDMTGYIETARTDDMGQLLRTLRQLNINLHSIIGDVRNNFEQMSRSAQEIAAGNMDLSGRTESQASALEETASSMEQLAATVEQNAGHATTASKMAGAASSVAQAGGAIVGDVITTIGDISDASRKIGDIIGIIDGIAFQTNILALNAAVEAARAGEQGRGFAVVAGEVRSLAQRSASAALEIRHLIDRSVEQVDAGTVLARKAGTTMQDIIASVDKVTGIMGEISAASREQSAGISQVNQAVTQMDEVTQRNAALVEQAAAATTGLSEQAAAVMQALAVFKLKGAPGQVAVPAKGSATPRIRETHAVRFASRAAIERAGDGDSAFHNGRVSSRSR